MSNEFRTYDSWLESPYHRESRDDFDDYDDRAYESARDKELECEE